MRKPAFCICEKQRRRSARGNHEADQHFCFRYTHSTIPLLRKIRNFKPLTIFCGCTAWFVSDQVGNPEDRFSHDEAHIICFGLVQILYFLAELDPIVSNFNNKLACH